MRSPRAIRLDNLLGSDGQDLREENKHGSLVRGSGSGGNLHVSRGTRAALGDIYLQAVTLD